MPPRLPLLLTLAALAAFPTAAQALPAGRTVIVSGNDTLDGALPAPTNDARIDRRGALSDDGRYVVFASGADGLSSEDDNRFENVFVKDRVTGAVTLVSRRTGAAGAPAHGTCRTATISDDGRRVAFTCLTPLDPADTNDHRDVYVRDLVTQTTSLVSRAAGGAVANGEADEPMISGDGSTVVFRSTATNLDPADANTRDDVFIRTLGASPATILVSRADGLAGAVGNTYSAEPSITDDGHVVAFSTQATNLTAAADANGHLDVYVRDIVAGSTVLASAPDLSAAATGDGDSSWPVISGQQNGGQYYVAFTTLAANLGWTDANGTYDVYRRALVNGATTLVTRTPGATPEALAGGGGAGGISDDGTDVAFGTSTSLDPADTSPEWSSYVRHFGTGKLELLSRLGDAGPELGIESDAPAVAGDGKAFAFDTEGGGGTPDADPVAGGAFVRDLHHAPRTTELVSRPAGSAPFVNQGGQAEGFSGKMLSADGSRALFSAVRGGGRTYQAWVRDLRTGALTLASRADGPTGAPDTGDVWGASISADGNRVAWMTDTPLDPADTDGQTSIYVRDLSTGRTYFASRADGADGAPANGHSDSPVLDADGSRVAFMSTATNLGDGDSDAANDVHVRDLATNRTLLVSTGKTGWSGHPAIDAAGTHVAFSSTSSDLGDGDKDATADIHVRDLATGTLRLVSATPAGVKGDQDSWSPEISDDGSAIAFVTHSPKLTSPGNTVAHVLVRDLTRGTLTIADRADGPNGAPGTTGAYAIALSGDGTKVAWAASGGTYVESDKPFDAGQVRVRDLVAATTTIGSRADGAAGAPASRDAGVPSLSRDGGCLLFFTASPWAAGAGMDFDQAYVRALSDTCIPAPPQGGGGNGADATAPVLSRVKLSRARFAVGKRATATVARRRRGAVLRFTTSEAGTLRVKVQRRRKGAFRTKAQLVRTVAAGKGRLKFSGRIGRHALAPGRYRLVVTVADAAGNRSEAAKVRFRIVR